MCIRDRFKGEYKVTSEFLASSINVNPVIIRRILSQLRDAGIVEVRRGTGGAAPAKPLQEITLLDVYRAVDCVEEKALFHFHENPNMSCPVGRNIHNILAVSYTHLRRDLENSTQGAAFYLPFRRGDRNFLAVLLPCSSGWAGQRCGALSLIHI